MLLAGRDASASSRPGSRKEVDLHFKRWQSKEIPRCVSSSPKSHWHKSFSEITTWSQKRFCFFFCRVPVSVSERVQPLVSRAFPAPSTTQTSGIIDGRGQGSVPDGTDQTQGCGVQEFNSQPTDWQLIFHSSIVYRQNDVQTAATYMLLFFCFGDPEASQADYDGMEFGN